MTRIKICCISTVEEAKLAIRYGASAIGLVSNMPSGPGIIEEKIISTITKTIPPGVASFLLTSKQSCDEIIQQQKMCGTNTLQLCDRVEIGVHEKIKRALPGIKIVQVIHVVGEESIAEALEMSKHVDAILLDSGNQNLEVKELGGTGRTHNWNISRKIREVVTIPIFLAGGLNHENVNQAINFIKPFAVDVCSGVRTNNHLDESKLKLFFEKVKEAEQ
jgi:phosphoribosylanthranilate isomerase